MRLTIEEILAKFIDEGKHEHEEMEIFIKEFRTTNELLLNERSNLWSDLKIKVNELSKVMGNVLILKNKVKGVTRLKPPLIKELMKLESTITNLLDLNRMCRKTGMILEEACKVTMNERNSDVLLNKLPSKEKDPRSFTIPCQVGHFQINNALADLGASISLMPYTMYENLGLGEPKPTRISLKLADRSIQYQRGIVKNVLIKVDKFILPIDFVILDMPEDSRIPIILERPFLATARAMIDVFNKKITFRVGYDEVIFDMDQSTKTLELLENDQLDLFLLKGLEKSINQSNLESNFVGDEFDNNSEVDLSIRRIDLVNTPYAKAKETEGTDRVLEKCKGVEDLAADHLSSLENPHVEVLTEKEIADEFLDKHLMLLNSKFNDDEPWTAYKTPTRFTPFRLVYGKACNLAVEIKHNTHWALKQCNMDLKLSSKSRLMQLNELAELRDGAYENTRIYKE
nr:hypothetical protein [Tanacetum cinerariifolium]